jgi:uncharacterized protein YecT (DUF1311 family)
MPFPSQSSVAVLAAIFLLVPSLCLSQNQADCQLDGNQRELNECAYSRLTKADAEMNRLYSSQLSHLGAAPKERFRASQRAWILYRDKACHYEAGPREESGSIWSMQDSLCRESLTKQRNEVLKTYVECRQNGCPE